MKGTRPLNNTEIQKVSECFDGTFQVRNRGLFLLGVSTGGRISELLSPTTGDVYQSPPDEKQGFDAPESGEETERIKMGKLEFHNYLI